MKLRNYALALLTALGAAATADAQGRPAGPTAPAESTRQQEAYYQFLLARRLDDQGQTDAAIAAYRKAAELDPAAADISADLAELYARQDRAEDAVVAARAALRLDPDNTLANWVLGTVYAAVAEGILKPPASIAGSSDDPAASAIEHLERARRDRVVDPGLEFRLGRLYLNTEAYDKAIQALAPFEQDDSVTAEVRFLLARAYAGAGRNDDAIRLLKNVIEEDPTSTRARIALAEIYEQDGLWNEAAAAYAGAVAQRPRSRELQVRQGAALLNAGDAVGARDLLRKLVGAGPGDASTLYLLAQAELQTNDFTAAEAAARRAIAADPDDLRGRFVLAQVFERRREPQKTIETLKPLLEPPFKDRIPDRQLAAVLTRVGFAYLDLKENERAVAAFEQAKTLSPPDSSLEVYLVQAQLAARQYAQAIERARQARGRFPDDLRLARLEAQALHESGQTERGVAILKEVITARPDDSAAPLALASLYADARRLDEAAAVLEQAQTTFPDEPSVAFELGAVFEQQKRYDLAEREFRRVLERDPLHAPTLNYLGYMLAEHGGSRLDESIELIRRALEVDPSNGSYLDSLGWAYFKQNKFDLAEKFLSQAADQLRDNSVVQDHHGDVLNRLGRFQDAVTAWERSLAGDGDSIDVTAIERKIKTAREKTGAKKSR